MKRFLLSAAMLAALSGGVSAQTSEIPAPKRHYINLGYANQTLEPEGYGALKSDNGAAIEFGSSFFFNNKKPVFGMARVGLDFSYLDIQGALFEQDEFSDSENGYFGNIGMQIGPSITVTPVRHVHAHVYAHWAPSFAAYLPDGFDLDTAQGGFAFNSLTYGLKASYRFVTLGVEMRNATAQFARIKKNDDAIDFDDFEDIENIDDLPDLGEITDDLIEIGDKQKVRLPSVRFVFGFRF